MAVDRRRPTGDRRAPPAPPLGLPRHARDGCDVGNRRRSRPVAGAPPARPPDLRCDHPHDPRWLLAGRGRRDARRAPRHRRQLDLARPRPPPRRARATSMTDAFDLELRDRLARLAGAVPVDPPRPISVVPPTSVGTGSTSRGLTLVGLAPILAIVVVGTLVAGLAHIGPFAPGATDANGP